MSNLLSVCLYNTEPESSEELRAKIQGLNFVRLAAEVSSPDELANFLQTGRANLTFFHLDPDATPIVEVIEQVSTRFPDLALIAFSHNTNPEAILAPMRAGCDQFVCEPIDCADLATAVARVASKRALHDSPSRCICVTGASGGVGTSLLSANLAMEIGTHTEAECALVDMDFQFGDLAMNFDCEPKFTYYDLAASGAELDRSILQGSVEKLPSHVALLARPQQIAEQESILPEIVHRVTELLKQTYENVVIDVPVSIDQRSLAALHQANLILIVCQMTVPSVRNTKRYIDALVHAGIPDDHIQVVVNRGDNSGRVSKDDLEEMIKKPVFATVPNDYEFVAQSIDYGQPIASTDPKNPVRVAIRAMAERIVAGRDDAPVEQKAERRGFLGRLLAK